MHAVESFMRKSCFAFFAVLCCWSFQAEAWNPQVLNGRCRQSGNVCYSTIGNAGGRGSCCDPQNRNIVQCNKDNTCQGGRPYKWAQQDLPLSWYFNPNGLTGGYAGQTAAVYEGRLKTAFAAWTKPSCTSFRESYKGQTTKLPSRSDRLVVVFFANSAQFAQLGGGGKSALAFAMPAPDRSGRLLDADIVFNPAYNWGRGSNDVVSVAAHEMGHAIGFAHAPFTSSLMYYASTGRGNAWVNQYKSQLPSDEVSAVCATYPRKGPCTTDKDCGGCLRCSGGKCVSKNISVRKNLCKPCSSPNDCGTSGDICVRLKEGNRCAQACDSQECCPNGYRCSAIGAGTKMCIPETGECPKVSCTSDSNCGPGERCSSGSCAPKPVPLNPKTCKICKSNADCGSGNACLTLGPGDNRCAQGCVANNFCPTGYTCRLTGSGRYCVPENNSCPCASNSDCPSGQICNSNKSCQKAGGGTYGDKCDDKTPCAPKHECFQTQNGGFCAMRCGGSGSFPPGSPGSACASNGSCSLGARCYRFQGGSNACIKPCSSANACSGTGGRCYRVTQTLNFCLCRSDSECLSGQVCNKGGPFGQQAGACAPKAPPQKCNAGFDCKDAGGGGLKICQPGSTREVGDECGSNLGGCKQGLLCIQAKQGAANGNCFEECTSTRKCKFGGQCVLQGGNNRLFCACRSDSECQAAGLKCKQLGGFGVCSKNGGSTVKCGDGKCNGGENCATCAADCKCAAGQKCTNGACVVATGCGNGKCDGGENCGSCAADCKCNPGTACKNNQCVAATGCGNNRCDTGETCTTCAQDCKCAAGRVCNAGRCVKPAPGCGNGKCDTGENCTTCPLDCKCQAGRVCQQGACRKPTPCGNGTCDTGEDCSTCAADCKCQAGRVCQQGACRKPGDEPTNPGNGTPDAGEPNPPSAAAGCGCQAVEGSPYNTLFLLFLFALYALFMGYRRHRKSL